MRGYRKITEKPGVLVVYILDRVSAQSQKEAPCLETMKVMRNRTAKRCSAIIQEKRKKREIWTDYKGRQRSLDTRVIWLNFAKQKIKKEKASSFIKFS